MKIYLIIFSLLFCHQAFSLKSLETALELRSIKVEYYSTSNRGLVYVYDCYKCKKYYSFTTKPIIKKDGKIISFDEFLQDSVNVKYPTVFLDIEDETVRRINY